MSSKSRADLSQLRQRLGGLLTRLPEPQLAIYLAELLRWNPQLGLVSKRDPLGIVATLITRSIDLWDFVADALHAPPRGEGWRVADVGSGGGFPGIVWKWLSPGLELLLIERKERKAHFLERVVYRLQIDGVEILPADVRELSQDPSLVGTVDITVVMAVGLSDTLVRHIEPLLRMPGYLVTRHPEVQGAAPHSLSPQLRLLDQRPDSGSIRVIYEKFRSE